MSSELLLTLTREEDACGLALGGILSRGKKVRQRMTYNIKQVLFICILREVTAQCV